MNRKKALKGILGIVTLGLSSGVLYEVLKSADSIPVEQLPQKRELVAELAELIIPRTDTPGAKDAGVADFIIKMIIRNTDAKAQKTFLAGLSSLEHYAYNNYHKQFVDCNNNEKSGVLKHFEDKGSYQVDILNKVRKKLFGPPFFYQLRDLTVQGYCTSLVGATKGMAYDYIPVTYEACIPLKANQKAWATK